MTALDVLALCRSRGVELVPDGGRLLLRGPQAARDELRELVRGRKLELLAELRSVAARAPLPPNVPGERWSYDWRGQPVNLFGARPGEDGRPPIFVCPRPEGLQ
jgi:hypothetical protein